MMWSLDILKRTSYSRIPETPFLFFVAWIFWFFFTFAVYSGTKKFLAIKFKEQKRVQLYPLIVGLTFGPFLFFLNSLKEDSAIFAVILHPVLAYLMISTIPFNKNAKETI